MHSQYQFECRPLTAVGAKEDVQSMCKCLEKSGGIFSHAFILKITRAETQTQVRLCSFSSTNRHDQFLCPHKDVLIQIARVGTWQHPIRSNSRYTGENSIKKPRKWGHGQQFAEAGEAWANHWRGRTVSDVERWNTNLNGSLCKGAFASDHNFLPELGNALQLCGCHVIYLGKGLLIAQRLRFGNWHIQYADRRSVQDGLWIHVIERGTGRGWRRANTKPRASSALKSGQPSPVPPAHCLRVPD